MSREHGDGGSWDGQMSGVGFRGSDVEVCCDFAESGCLVDSIPQCSLMLWR